MVEVLSRYRAAWLADAELSVPVEPPVNRVGLSFFFRDSADLLELAHSEHLGAAWWQETVAVHSTFALVPRFWVKLTFADDERVAVTRYFAIPGGSGNPLTTLRLLVRRLGGACPPGFAAALQPYLGDPQVGWFVSQQQRKASGCVRFSVRLASAELLPYLGRAQQHGMLSQGQLEQYKTLAVPACDRIYVTLVVGDASQCAVDFRVSTSPHRYLKCRFRERAPEWTTYGPFREILKQLSG
jgi:hypothetical protein